MADSAPPLERELLCRQAARWSGAGEALAAIEARQLIGIDTQAAVRHVFGQNRLVQDAAILPTAGLVEQQFWFRKIAAKLNAR